MKKLSQQISGIVKSIGTSTSKLSDRRRGRRSRVRRMAVQALEPRMLLAFDVVAAETMLVYLVNQTRANPEATAARLAISLPAGEIGPFAPLVVNPALQVAARLHSEDMLANNFQSHTGFNGSSPGDRAIAAGYPIGVGENVQSIVTTGPISETPEEVARILNDGWFKSPPHRSNMLLTDWTEFGVGIAARLSAPGVVRGTEKFGDHDPGPFLTGVVFNDHNATSAYNVGEGLAGVTVTIAGPAGTFTATTMAAGAWSAKVPAGQYIVTASGTGFTSTSSVPIVVGNTNVAVDFISGIATGWVNFTQYVNAAPVLSTTPTPSLPPIVLGTSNPPGVPVSSLLIGAFSDVNPLSPQGIAITSAPTTAAGVWQYSTTGGSTWLNLDQPSVTVARLLRAQDLIRLLPSGSQATTATISYRAWDQSTGTAGANAGTTASGGSTAFSTAVETATVTAVLSNTAPVLTPTGGNNFTPVAEDTLSPAGTTVAAILGSSMSDVDPGTPAGIAVTGTTGSQNGVWTYSTNGGTSWVTLASASDTTAIPLRASDLLRFVPAKDFVGSASVTYRGWDQSTGRVGVAVNLASAGVVGGSTAYSVAKATAAIAVTPVNDAPTFLAGRSSLRFKPVAANTAFSFTGTTVADLLGNSVLDVDPSAKIGIAVVGVGANMTFYWNTGGPGWTTGGISGSNALLLKDTDILGFAPNSGFTGTTTISFRLWDQTAGTPGANLSNPSATTGGTTAFGSEVLTATLSIGPAGTAPTVTFGAVTRAGNGAAVASIPVTFSRSVEGLDAGDFVLTRNGATVPLQNATLTGSGTAFVLGNLANVTSTTGSYSLTIAATGTGVTDTAGNRTTGPASTTFSVTAVNDSPTSLTLDNGSIAENTAAATNIGTLTTADPDAGETFTYRLVNGFGDNVNFQITGNKLQTKAPLDFETKSSHSIKIRTTDAGGLFTEQTFTISVLNLLDGTSGIDQFDVAVGVNSVSITRTSNGGTPVAEGTFNLTPQLLQQGLTITGLGANDTVKLRGLTGNDSFSMTGAAIVLNGLKVTTGLAAKVTLDGGAGDDIYRFNANQTLNNVTITDSAGTDTLDFSATTVNISANLGVSSRQTVTPGLRLSVTPNTIENLIGGSGNDTLFGNALNNRITGNAGNDTIHGLQGDDTLLGGLGDDIYVFAAATAAEADTVTESLNQGTDTLNFAALTTNVAVRLNSSAVQAVHSNRTLKLNSVATFENLIGGSGNDTLIGNALNNRITGNAGNDTIHGLQGDDTLLGGTGDDIYVFAAATAAEADTITELAGGGTDTLNFSALTIAVQINLGSSAIQDVHTNRTLKLSGIDRFENVTGGSGDDILIGNGLNNILVGNNGNDVLTGNGGNDTLNGGNGRDILIGGDGLDTLSGGNDDDILIAGRTTSDTTLAKLMDMRAAWITALPYATRVTTLRSGVGSSVVSLKAKINVLNDAGEDDVLTGNAGQDWYFKALDDVITDLFGGELNDAL